MRKVAPPIRLTVVRKVALRPTRSPITPKMIAPSGLKAKPTANSASAAISAEVGSSPARNTLAMTGARLPKMKKSYHSNAVPAEDATTTRFIDQGLSPFAAISTITRSPVDAIAREGQRLKSLKSRGMAPFRAFAAGGSLHNEEKRRQR